MNQCKDALFVHHPGYFNASNVFTTSQNTFKKRLTLYSSTNSKNPKSNDNSFIKTFKSISKNEITNINATPNDIIKTEDSSIMKIIGSALLIAGGAIGAGTVALPVKTASSGFFPSVGMLMAGWVVMNAIAFLDLEVVKYCGAGSHFPTMCEKTLGNSSKIICIIIYLSVFSAALSAYIAESGNFLKPAIESVLNVSMPTTIYSLCFTFILASLIYQGARVIDWTNRIALSICLISYMSIMSLCTGNINPSSLLYANWSNAVRAFPISAVAFGYHNMVPSLLSYLGSAKAVRIAIIGGTLLPFAIYIAWEALIMGSIPPGGTGINSVTTLIQNISGSQKLSELIRIFSFFAILTSFLAIGLGSTHFIKDLIFKGKNEGDKSVIPIIGTFGLPLIIGYLFPSIFIPAMELSGLLTFVLFGILPCFMARNGPFKNSNVMWHNLLVYFVFASCICVMGIEAWNKFF